MLPYKELLSYESDRIVFTVTVECYFALHAVIVSQLENSVLIILLYFIKRIGITNFIYGILT